MEMFREKHVHVFISMKGRFFMNEILDFKTTIRYFFYLTYI